MCLWWCKSVKYGVYMKVDVSVGWVVLKYVVAEVGRLIVYEVDIDVGDKVGEVFEL